jgi:hypothetical protein
MKLACAAVFKGTAERNGHPAVSGRLEAKTVNAMSPVDWAIVTQ